MNFVTGGTGLVGSHLLFELTSNDEPIKALYRSEARQHLVRAIFKHYDLKNWESRFHKIEWVKGDILDITEMNTLITQGMKVYHCAAMVSFDDKFFNQMMHVNRDGTENIVNACLANNAKKLCYVSSTAAIGGEGEKVISEDTKWKNTPSTTGYSISKYCAEREVWRGTEEGLNAVIINPCVVFGAGSWNESSLTIFDTLKKGQSYYPPGSNATVDARDVANAMSLLMESDIQSERFLCIGSNQSFKDLMTEIAQQLGVKTPSKEAKRWQVNLARRILGVISFFTRKRPRINNDTVGNLFGVKYYEVGKIKNAIDINFRPLSEQVKNAIEGRYDSPKNS